MANYIVDASVIMNYLILDEHTENAQAFFDSITEVDNLLVPEFCLLECANVLWKHVRFHDMPQIIAENLVSDIFGLPLELSSIKPVLQAALQIGLRNELALYDSVYIAFALRTNTTLLTVDQKQGKAATREGAKLKHITEFTP